MTFLRQLAAASTVSRRFLSSSSLSKNIISVPIPSHPSLTYPCGSPLPPSNSNPPNQTIHSISVSLPKWSDIVGYEESVPSIVNSMTNGYPRFFKNLTLKRLEERIHGDLNLSSTTSLVLAPSKKSAERYKSFIEAVHHPNTIIRIHETVPNVCYAVAFPSEHAQTAKSCFQHCGDVVSSRRAERVLDHISSSSSSSSSSISSSSPTFRANTITSLKSKIHEYYPNTKIFLSPSGMCSIAKALRASQLLFSANKPGKVVVFGFPYLDTLKIAKHPQLSPGGYVFFGKGDSSDRAAFAKYVAQNPNEIACVVAEFPTNPLLHCTDLKEIANVLEQAKKSSGRTIPFIVDDTIGGFSNVDLRKVGEGAVTMITSSMSKFFNGNCDVLAGSLVLLNR